MIVLVKERGSMTIVRTSTPKRRRYPGPKPQPAITVGDRDAYFIA
jgi:hypothetical protein